LGTTRIASRSGHTIGPPAENAHAVDPVGVATSTPSQPNADTGRPSTSSTAPSTLQAGLVQGPAAINDVALGADDDVKRHAFLDAVIAFDDMLQHGVDVVGLGFGEEADAAQIHTEHRYFDIASQLGGALVGVDHFDLDPECAHVVGRQVHRTTIDGFGGQHA
jgi:hypothetical protein